MFKISFLQKPALVHAGAPVTIRGPAPKPVTLSGTSSKSVGVPAIAPSVEPVALAALIPLNAVLNAPVLPTSSNLECAVASLIEALIQ